MTALADQDDNAVPFFKDANRNRKRCSIFLSSSHRIIRRAAAGRTTDDITDNPRSIVTENRTSRIVMRLSLLALL
jgi:hypothetical protein